MFLKVCFWVKPATCTFNLYTYYQIIIYYIHTLNHWCLLGLAFLATIENTGCSNLLPRPRAPCARSPRLFDLLAVVTSRPNSPCSIWLKMGLTLTHVGKIWLKGMMYWGHWSKFSTPKTFCRCLLMFGLEIMIKKVESPGNKLDPHGLPFQNLAPKNYMVQNRQFLRLQLSFWVSDSCGQTHMVPFSCLGIGQERSFPSGLDDANAQSASS